MTSFAELQATYKAKPGATNILVTKGTATAGNHQGAPYFNPDQQATVAAWIDSL